MNAPLLLTVGRAAAAAPIPWLLSRADRDGALLAAAVFAVAAASDMLDGWLARRLGQVTRVGTFLDPLADKALVVATLLGLAQRGLVPAWVVVLVVAREAAVTALRAVAASRGLSIGATFYGSAKTVAQCLAAFALLLALVWPSAALLDAAYALLAAALGLTVFSGADYITKASCALVGGRAPDGWRVARARA